MSSGSKSGNAGYRYFFGIHAGIGRGEMDELVEIRVGTKLAAQPQMTQSGTGTIDVPELFGGEQKEGGIKGNFHLLMGEPTQTMPSALAAMISPVPPTGFRRMVTFFYDGLVASMNPYPKPWSFRMRRALKGWDGEPIAPSLAVIELQGQANTGPDAPVAYGSTIYGTQRAIAPKTHMVQALIAPQSGFRITREYTFDGTLNYTIVNGIGYPYVIPMHLQEDGTALLDFPPNYYGKTIDNFEFEFEPLAGPDGRFRTGQAAGNQIDLVPQPVRLTFTPPAGKMINGLNSLELMDAGNEVYAGVVPYNIEYLPTGQARVSVAPPFWGKQLVADVTYEGGGGGGLYAMVDDIGPFPPTINFVPPTNGRFLGIESIQVEVPPPVEATDLRPDPVDIPFTMEGNVITLLSPLASGNGIIINYTYQLAKAPTEAGDPITLIKAMNPAHIVFECLTNREWGRGLDRSLFNTPSFEAGALTLFNEKFGLCLRWSRRDSIDSFVQSVLDTIGAVIYMDRTSALLTFKLIRKDYVTADLKIWDTSNGILTITNSNVNTSSVIINEVIVKYREAIFNEDRAVNVQNLASLQSGSFKTMTKEYKGIPTSDLARRVAQRDLRANAEGLRRFTLTMDARGSNIMPGQVMRIQDIARNLPPIVVRVATAKDGTATNGQITLRVVQDVFAFPAQSFTADQENAWVPPNFSPCIGEHEVFEAPYFLLARKMRQADFAFVDNASAYLAVVAEQAKPSNVGYDIAVRGTAPSVDDMPSPNEAMYCGYEPPAEEI